MTDQIKSKMVFDAASDDKKGDESFIETRQQFSEQEAQGFYQVTTDIESEQDDSQVEGIVNQALKPKRSLWRKLVMVGLGLFSLSVIAQTVQWINNAWQQQDWISLGAAFAGSLIIVASIGAVITEWRRLYRLKERAEERDTAKTLLSSHSTGHQGKMFCEKLAEQAGLGRHHPAFMRWQDALHETHSDKEVVELYAKLVQPVLDGQARREISRYATESAIMIAVSPLALVDMAFIAWRNIKLINRIANIYGIELGYFSRMRLFRLVLINVAFAGATELVREVGMDWLSQDIAARLSTRAAQGIGAGLLTARLGIKAMELCRPLPWLANDKPKLGDFRKTMLGQIKTLLAKKSTG